MQSTVGLFGGHSVVAAAAATTAAIQTFLKSNETELESLE